MNKKGRNYRISLRKGRSKKKRKRKRSSVRG